MSRAEHSKDGLADWLSKYRWDWFATLRLDYTPASRRRALETFDNWLDELEQREGGRHFRWVRVITHDGNWGNICLYVLVGGFQNKRRYYEKQWSEHCGRALIEDFDPSPRGIKRMLNKMDRDADPDMDYHLE